ncbi:MAG: hypothetical protein IKG69_06830, partial [Atopobiaceae bacterium]|nr:hypothetical protein [Atopobiaceae bacterium]
AFNKKASKGKEPPLSGLSQILSHFFNPVFNPVSFKVIKHRYCAHTVKILCSADKMLPLNLCASVGLLFNRVEYSQS